MKTIKYITNYSLWLACALFAVLFTACDDDEASALKVNRLAGGGGGGRCGRGHYFLD